jgi:hypothetical protein
MQPHERSFTTYSFYSYNTTMSPTSILQIYNGHDLDIDMLPIKLRHKKKTR